MPFALFGEADYPVLATLVTLSPEDAARVASRNHLRRFPALGPLGWVPHITKLTTL